MIGHEPVEVCPDASLGRWIQLPGSPSRYVFVPSSVIGKEFDASTQLVRSSRRLAITEG
jgi:hypothetical protein